MKIARIFRFLLLTIFFLLLGAAVFLFISFRTSLPQRKDSLKLPGLREEVIVKWDRWGVPHIRASNEPDLFLATGYIQASERLWQMELFRRIALGRLAEIVGEQGLKIDLRSRVLGFPVAVEKDYQKLPDEMKKLLAAYADGVNAFLKSRRWNWPPEFIVLRIRPEPWRIEDTLSIKYLLAMGLAADLSSKVSRMNLIKRAGPRAIELMEPGIDFLPDPEIRLDAFPPAWSDNWLNHQVVQGSNNWVISGEKTVSGKPLLANDPHLNISLPPIWMEISLEVPEYKVSGVTIPGVPVVVIGHNQNIAWGVTNSYVDVQDIFVEEVDWDREAYRRGKEWKAFSSRKEEIKIKGRNRPRTLEIRWTEEGPILSPYLLKSEMPLSLHWTIYEGDRTVEGLYLINRARNWTEFRHGVRLFENPSQNFVYADVDGNIGYYLSGKIPVRKKEIAPFPYPGWRDEKLWQGYLDEEDKPNLFNPQSGVIVTANSSIVPEGYPHFLGFDWLIPDRKNRILELLLSQDKHSVESLIAIQNDVFSRRAERLKKVLAEIKLTNPEAEEAREILLQWSGEVREGMAPALFEVFWEKFQELTFSDELTSSYPDAARYFRVKETGLEKILDRPDSSWYDRIDTPEKETRDMILEKAFLETLKILKKEYGRKRENWDWSRMHSLKYQHLLGQKWFLSFFNAGRYPMIGDSNTVRASFGGNGWETTGGASCRLIIDLSDFDRSLSVITSGQSGHFMSPHYKDQIPLYLNSLYHPWAFSDEAVSRIHKKTIKLIPDK
jgi:penicillin amidase